MSCCAPSESIDGKSVVADTKSLAQYVELAIKRHHGVSGRRLADIAAAKGYEISYNTINRIRSGTYASMPTNDTLLAIAWLAGVAKDEIFAAASRDVPGPPFIDELPPDVDTLKPRERDAVLEVAKALLAQRQELLRSGQIYGEQLVRLGARLSSIQALVEAVIKDDDAPDADQLEAISEQLNALAYTIEMTALHAYGGDESRYKRTQAEVAIDLRARDAGLVRPRAGTSDSGLPDATTVLADGLIQTEGITSDGARTTSIKQIHHDPADYYDTTTMRSIEAQTLRPLEDAQASPGPPAPKAKAKVDKRRK